MTIKIVHDEEEEEVRKHVSSKMKIVFIFIMFMIWYEKWNVHIRFRVYPTKTVQSKRQRDIYLYLEHVHTILIKSIGIVFPLTPSPQHSHLCYPFCTDDFKQKQTPTWRCLYFPLCNLHTVWRYIHSAIWYVQR